MSATPKPPRSLANLPVETWAEIRQAYLAGETAAALAARHGVSAKTVYARSHRERWTKRAGTKHARAEANALAAREALLLSAVGGDGAALRKLVISQAAVAAREARGEVAARLLKLAAGAELPPAGGVEASGPTQDANALGAALFELASKLAYALLIAPETAPAAFEAEVAAWRTRHLPPPEEAEAELRRVREIASAALRRLLEE